MHPPHLPRMAELVAAQLRSRIVAGELQDGDELPRESDLREEFGVSRPSLREAVRILETEGLLRIRRGKVGGAIVSRPNAESAGYHLGLSLQSRGATLRDVASAREVLEPACVGLVAALPEAERARIVAILTALIDENEAQVGGDTDFTAGALTFHHAVIEHCGNTTISLLTSSVESVWSSQERRWAARATALGDYPVSAYQRDVIRAHRKIVRAIAAGRPPAASDALREHLSHSQPYVGFDEGPLDATSVRI